MIKSKAEIAEIRAACLMPTQMFETVPQYARLGATEKAVARQLDH